MSRTKDMHKPHPYIKQLPYNSFRHLPIALALTLILSSVPRPVRANSLFSEIGDIYQTISSVLELISIDIPSIDYWAEAIQDDPCHNDQILWIVSPKPGWCRGRRSTMPSGTEIVLATTNGALGLPNSNATREEVNSRTLDLGGSELGDLFERNPTIVAKDIADSIDRGIARDHVESTFGEEGQQTMAEELNTIQSTLEDTGNIAQEAQSAISTQDVVKAQAELTANLHSTLSSIHAQMIVQRQTAARNLTIQANISDALSRIEKAQNSSYGDAQRTFNSLVNSNLF